VKHFEKNEGWEKEVGDLGIMEIAYLLDRCPDLAAVIPGVRTLDELRTFDWSGYSPVKGAVQSGKTRFMIYASLLLRLAKMDVVVLLRNLLADREQFGKRMDAARAEWSSRFPDEGSIFVGLTNASACRRMELEVRGKNYALIIDEADACDSFSDGRTKDQFLSLLKAGARRTFGVSATVMDLIGKHDVAPSSLILLTPPADYRGFMDLVHVPIETESAFSSRTDCDLLIEDPGLDSFVGHFSDLRRPKPCIGLVNICRTKAPCYRAVRDDLQRRRNRFSARPGAAHRDSGNDRRGVAGDQGFGVGDEHPHLLR